MEKNVIKKDQTATVIIDESGSEWVLAKGVALAGAPAFRNGDYDNVTLSISGEISTSGNGIFLGSAIPGESPDEATVIVNQSGRINAEYIGIFSSGDDATIKNNGQVKGSWNAIFADGDNVSVVNTGLLRSADLSAIDLSGSDVFSIRNTGRIETVAGDFAISGQNVENGRIVNMKSGVVDGAISFKDAGNVEIINKGKIAEDVGADNNGISFEAGNDRLINRGLIGGKVNFGGGDDFADFRHGDVSGAFVIGGSGDDTFIISDLSLKIFELQNAGTDTIKTTVSYTLGNMIVDHIEKLAAIGTKDIDLTGNDKANDLTGNAGDNVLLGGGGDDVLTGNRGNDILSGGDGADDFYFYRKTGNDTIVGLDVDEDVIHLGNIPGIGTLEDLESHFTTAKDGDVIIDLGTHGSIRLDGVVATDIDDIEFQIEL